jgi:hypothetical protein
MLASLDSISPDARFTRSLGLAPQSLTLMAGTKNRNHLEEDRDL